jgi:hypothetical protein
VSVITTRQQRLYGHLQREVANEQERAKIRSAYRRLDMLRDQLARVEALPWHRRPEGRVSALMAAVDAVEQEIRELEGEQEIRAMFRLPPVLDDPPQRATGRPGLPPAWRI